MTKNRKSKIWIKEYARQLSVSHAEAVRRLGELAAEAEAGYDPDKLVPRKILPL